MFRENIVLLIGGSMLIAVLLISGCLAPEATFIGRSSQMSFVTGLPNDRIVFSNPYYESYIKDPVQITMRLYVNANYAFINMDDCIRVGGTYDQPSCDLYPAIKNNRPPVTDSDGNGWSYVKFDDIGRYIYIERQISGDWYSGMGASEIWLDFQTGEPAGSDEQCTRYSDCINLPHIACAGEWDCAGGVCVWTCYEPPVGPVQPPGPITPPSPTNFLETFLSGLDAIIRWFFSLFSLGGAAQ